MAQTYGSNAPDTLEGTAEADTLYGWDIDNPDGDLGPDSDDDLVQGLAGNDWIFAGAGDDRLEGGAGADYLYGGSGFNTVYGGNGDDFFWTATGNNLIFGGDGDDDLSVYFDEDSVYGGAGNDVLSIDGPGSFAVLDGGEGIDRFGVNGYLLPIQLNMSAPVMTYNGLEIIGFEQGWVYGSQAGDRLIGASLSDDFTGNAGDDLLSGRDGNDVLDGGAGDDTLEGGAGDDLLFTADYYDGAEGAGTDVISGGAGVDFLSIYLARGDHGAQRIILSDSFEFGSGSTATGIEQFWVETGGLDDTITGGDLADTIYAGDGANRLSGGQGADRIVAGAGQDLMFGGDGDDDLLAGHGDNQLHGESGADYLASDKGLDLLYGGEGDDTLFGGRSKDAIDGGAGADQLYGGRGHDFFDFVTAPLAGETDTLWYFEIEKDLIRLSAAAFDALPLGNLRDHSFVLGKRALDHNDHILYDPDSGELRYDADGKGGAAAVLFLTLAYSDPLTADVFKVI
jgi:Ca2+-binding RTX toxin-like protein